MSTGPDPPPRWKLRRPGPAGGSWHPAVINQHSVAYLLGLSCAALLRAFNGEYGRDFTDARLAEISALLNEPDPLRGGRTTGPDHQHGGLRRLLAARRTSSALSTRRGQQCNDCGRLVAGGCPMPSRCRDGLFLADSDYHHDASDCLLLLLLLAMRSFESRCSPPRQPTRPVRKHGRRNDHLAWRVSGYSG